MDKLESWYIKVLDQMLNVKFVIDVDNSYYGHIEEYPYFLKYSPKYHEGVRGCDVCNLNSSDSGGKKKSIGKNDKWGKY